MAHLVSTRDDVEIGLAEESTWGTAITTGTSYELMDCEPTQITPGKNVRMPTRANAARQPLDEEVRIDSDQKEQTVTLAGPVILRNFAQQLYSVFQNVTEEAGDPFQKVFSIGSGQPQFESDEGHFTSICTRDGTVARMIEDCVGSSITLSVHPTNNAGRLYASTNMFGRKFTANQEISGAMTTLGARTYYSFADIQTQTIDSTPYSLAELNMTLANGAKGAGVDGTDLGLYSGVAMMGFELSGTISFLWEAGLEALLGDAVQTIVIDWGSTGVAGFFQITLEAKFGEAVIQEGETRIMQIPLIGVNETNGMALITMADVIDRTW